MKRFYREKLFRVMPRCVAVMSLLMCCALVGCGNSVRIEGTQQLLASDAIDQSIAKIDFTPLRGQQVYFDAQYIKSVKGIGFVNADYIISALRQELVANGCKMVEDKKEARFIVEARVGALGGNQHDIIYGIPENNAISSVASVLPNSPPIPSIPELSVARRSHMSASAKVAVFAYEKETGESVWQSGTSVADSDAQNTWLFGAGPFQKGSIYDGTELAGERIRAPWNKKRNPNQGEIAEFHRSRVYRNLMFEQLEADTAIVESENTPQKDSGVQPASHETPVQKDAESEQSPGEKTGEEPGKARVGG